MAFPVEEDFDDIANGDLSSDAAWTHTGGAQVQVQSTVSQSASKAAKITAVASGVTTPVTASTSGTMYYAWRYEAYTSGDCGRILLSDASANRAINIKGADSGGLKFQYKNGATWTNYFTPTVDTWYIIEVTYDASTDDYDIRYKEVGGSYDAGVTGISFDQTSGDITLLKLSSDNATAYWDSISATDPDGGAAPAEQNSNFLMFM